MASVPGIPGCHAYGRTTSEAIRRVKSALRFYLQEILREGRRLPKQPKPITVEIHLAVWVRPTSLRSKQESCFGRWSAAGSGSYARGEANRFLKHHDGRTMVFAFHDGETIGPRMLAKVLKDAGIPFETLNREL